MADDRAESDGAEPDGPTKFPVSTVDDASSHDDAHNSNLARPKPWWQDHPEIEALRTRVREEIESLPERPAAISRADLHALREYFGDDYMTDQSTSADAKPGDFAGSDGVESDDAESDDAESDAPAKFSTSTIDDASSHDDAQNSNPARPTPWWQDHPDIKALRTRVREEIESLPERPPIDYPDPILSDVVSGTSVRELCDARAELDRAKARYDAAVRTARTLGLSWGRIGTITGVSRQQLHRRYRDTAG